MKSTEETINNLTDELANLSAKIGSLESFVVSKDYQEVTQTQQRLLLDQHSIMEMYKKTLLKRLLNLRNQEYQATAKCCPEEESEAESGTPTD